MSTDLRKVELSLTWAIRGALSDIREAWGIRDPDHLLDHPLVGDFVALTAALVLARRKSSQGLSPTAALREACTELGLNPETTRSRIASLRKRYLDARASGVESHPDHRKPEVA